MAQIKALYRELNLERVYETYEAEVHRALTEKIAQTRNVPQRVFTSFLERIFKRKK